MSALLCVALLVLPVFRFAHADEKSSLPTIMGRVTAADGGKPLPGVSVSALSPGDGAGVGTRLQTVTDARGDFRFDRVPVGRVLVVALGNGWVSGGLGPRSNRTPCPLWARVERGQVHKINVSAVRAATLSGVVRDHSGAPVSDASVRLTPGPLPGWFEHHGAGRTVRTNAEGRYVADTLVPGATYELVVLSARSPEAFHELPAAARGQVYDVALDRPEWGRVRVRDRQGQPVGKARVEVYWADPKEYGAPVALSFLTTAAGFADLGPLPPGGALLRVRAEGYLPYPSEDGSQSIALGKAGARPAVVQELQLERSNSLRGTVLLHGGDPAVGVTVAAGSRAKGIGGFSTTNARGEYLVNGLAGGTVRVVVYSPAPDTQELTSVDDVPVGGKPVIIRLPKGALSGDAGEPAPRYLGFTLEGPDGRPVPRARVTWHLPGSRGSLTLLNGRGRLLAPDPEFEPVGARYWVEVSHARTEGGTALPLGSLILGPYETTVSRLMLRLEPERIVRGVILDAGALPVVGVVVRAVPAALYAEGAESSAHAEATTDKAGAFELRGLGPYEYRLEAEPGAGRVAPIPAPRVVAPARTIKVILPTPVRPTVQISNWPTKPNARPHAFLSTRGRGTRVIAIARVGVQGDLKFPAVPEGLYHLWIAPQGDHSLYVESFRASSRLVNLKLLMGRDARGTVVLPKGAGRCFVRVLGPGVSISAPVDTDGAFVLRAVPAGTWTVEASVEVDEDLWTGRADTVIGEPLVIEVRASHR